MKKIVGLLAAAVVMAAVALPGSAQQAEVLVSAAASLTDVLNDLGPAAEAYVGAKVTFNYGGSGTLRHQIEAGAPVDVFFSAAAEDMDKLQQEGLIAAGSRRDFLSNSMVMVGDSSQGTAATVDELRALVSRVRFFAIGNPDAVPAGRYATQALMSTGLYPLVKDKRVLGGTVREVLQFVQSGSAPLGIVFLTDFLSLKGGGDVKLVYQFPPDSVRTPIIYPIAVVAASRGQQAAGRFIQFLMSEASRERFRSAGFLVK